MVSVRVLLMLVGADERRNVVVGRTAVLVPQPTTLIRRTRDRASLVYSFTYTNKMQRYTILFIPVNALHLSGGFSTHHQELKTVHTASGICQAWYIPDITDYYKIVCIFAVSNGMGLQRTVFKKWYCENVVINATALRRNYKIMTLDKIVTLFQLKLPLLKALNLDTMIIFAFVHHHL